MDLGNKAKITWCPGCSDFAILAAAKGAIGAIIAEKTIAPENFVIAAGIGCHGKIADYLNLNSFIGLHGRAIPMLIGMKLANPDLKAVGFVGDGDAYAEGMEHLIHAAKRNADITVIVHNNQIFALTNNQFTPTSPKGYKGRSTPYGSVEEPINIFPLILSAGATFLARAYAYDMAPTQAVIKQAILHKGFSLVEIIQPCITLNDTREYFKSKVYWLGNDYDSNNLNSALSKCQEIEKLPLGVFYHANKPVFEEGFIS
ncbi:MAG: thiamine pyrophosphate-dependent enzyme [Candidatus Magasanikbacteria bacterium]